MKCPLCEYTLSGDYDLNEPMQRLFALHLQTCAMKIEKLKVDYLSVIATALVDGAVVKGPARDQLVALGERR